MGVAVVCVADGLQAAIAVVDLSLALNVPIHDQLSRDYGLRSVNCHGVRSLNGNRRVFSFHYDPGSGEVNLSPQIIENAYLAILESRGAAASVGDAESDRVLSVTRQGGRKHFSPRFSLGSEAVRFEMLDIITQVVGEELNLHRPHLPGGVLCQQHASRDQINQTVAHNLPDPALARKVVPFLACFVLVDLAVLPFSASGRSVTANAQGDFNSIVVVDPS